MKPTSLSSGTATRLVRHLGVALLLFAVACGETPTQEEAAPVEPAGEPAGEAAEPAEAEAEGTEPAATAAAGDCAVFDEVYAALEGMEGQERTDALVAMAQEEGELNVYTSNTDLADQAELFTDTYDVDVSLYRAQGNQVLQRVLQEAEAGFEGADVFEGGGEEMVVAASEGLLDEYEGPATEGLVEGADQNGWVATRFNVFTVSHNTDLVQEPPTSNQDLGDPRFEGLIMIEPRAFEWYMTLSDHYVNEEGMTQEEVDELFSQIAANATQVTGNTAHANFLASGEYGVSTSVYSHLVDELEVSGAPVSRTPAVEPVIIRPNGIAPMCSAQNPASAVLFTEWVLTDAQPLLVEDYRVPSRASAQQDNLQGLNTITVDMERVLNERPEWEERYGEILRNAQAEPAG